MQQADEDLFQIQAQSQIAKEYNQFHPQDPGAACG